MEGKTKGGLYTFKLELNNLKHQRSTSTNASIEPSSSFQQGSVNSCLVDMNKPYCAL